MNGEIILRRHIHGEHGIYIVIEWALLQLKSIQMIIYRIEMIYNSSLSKYDL